jgi:hypothetical protein
MEERELEKTINKLLQDSSFALVQMMMPVTFFFFVTNIHHRAVHIGDNLSPPLLFIQPRFPLDDDSNSWQRSIS